MKKIFIIGATSAIATEVARLFAAQKCELFLVGRDTDKLERLSADLEVRGAASVTTRAFVGSNLEDHAAIVAEALTTLGEFDGVLIAHGSLSYQKECESDWSNTHEALAVNFLSPIAILTPIAQQMEKQRRGNITVISSVAGDRGRQSNYVYGAAKAGLSSFLQGLRNRLVKSGVSVTTIKPGFVDTPMTAHLEKTKMFAKASDVGARIFKAMTRGEDVVYTPIIWWPIMTVIKIIPERIFKKLSL